MGACVDILEWARKEGYEFDCKYHFHSAAMFGNVRVLEWAEEKNLEWYSEGVLHNSANRGDIVILELIQTSGHT